MSLSKFESEVKYISRPVEEVYGRFADLRHLEGLKERLNDPEVAARMAGQVPADKVEELKKYAEGMVFTADSLQIVSPVGALTLRIVEREAPKCIKFQSEGSPIPSTCGYNSFPRAGARPRCASP